MEFNTKLSKLIARRKVIETYFIVNSIFYNDCEDKTKVPISSIKSVLYSLKRKGFISNYKDKHNNNIKGCYVIK